MTDIGTLELIPAAEIRAVWPDVRDRIAGIAEACGEPWIADDVFHEILVGNAYLWGTADLGCFVVLMVEATAYSRDLRVWIASEETDARAAEYVPQLQAIASEAQCNRVIFDSPRRWERALPGVTVRYSYSFET
ncbi:MAG TPA: hypothetical protein VF638_02255 [Sphingomonas sp.]